MRYKNIKNLSNTSWTIIDNPGVILYDALYELCIKGDEHICSKS